MGKFLLPVTKNIAVTILVATLCFAVNNAKAQIPNCDGSVPTYTVNFTNNPTGTFTTPDLTRDGHCCTASGSDRCINFVITIDSNTVAFNFQITSGAIPPGALYYQVDCGPETQVGQAICVSGVGTHYLTFCKPGNNTNQYTVSAVPRPIFRDDTIALGCRDTAQVFGIVDAGATYTSISPGTPGQYNNLLSCTTGCARPVFTPVDGTPTVVQYRVCGTAVASQCVGTQQFCDTISFRVDPRWSNRPDTSICSPSSTINLGAAPAGATWNAATGNPAAATINASTGAATGLTIDGAYRFFLRTTNGLCTDTVIVNRISQAAAPSITTNSPLCTGQTLTLSTPTVSGATYTWSGPNSFTSNLQNPTITNVTQAATGSYTLTIKVGACTSAPGSANVVVFKTPAQPNAGSNSPVCSGNTLTFNATSADTGAYSWTGPNSFSSTLQNPSIGNVTTAATGLYFVTLSANGCTSIPDTVSVTINQTPAAPSASSNSPVCVGNTITLTATGTSLQWSFPDGGGASGSPVNRANATLAMQGNYNVTQSVSGCISAASTVSVTVNPNPTITAGVGSITTCSADTLKLTSTPSGGSGVYTTFAWSSAPPASAFTSNLQNPIRTPALTNMSGPYTVTVTDDRGCTGSATVNVTVRQSPAVSATSSSADYCSGDSIKLFATPSGAVGTVLYSWSGPGFTSSLQNPVRPNATTAMSGSYTVTVTDNNGTNGCSATSSTAVNVDASPVVSISGNLNYCTLDTIRLTANAAGGTGSYTYAWSTTPNTGFNPGNVQVATRTNLTTGMTAIYIVTVTDGNGCTATAATTDTVRVLQSPSAAPTANPTTYCSGDTVRLFANATNTVATTTYSWSSNPAGFTSSAQDPTRPNAPASTGTYSVTVTSGNGCTVSATTGTVTVHQSPTLAAFSSSAAYCSGDTIKLFSTPSSGTPPYTYVWGTVPATGFTTGNNVQNPIRVNATTGMSATYNVTVTDNNGCSASTSAGAIVVNPSLTVNAGSNSPVCAGGTISLTSSTTSGLAPYNYSWTTTATDNTGFTPNNNQNPTRASATTDMAGTYTVTITDSRGCSGTGSVNVVVNPTATLNVTSNSPVCTGGTLSLNASLTGGTAPFTYSWSHPSDGFTSTLANPTRTNAVAGYAGAYLVTVTDDNGCSGVGQTSVSINQTTSVAVSSNSTVCFNDTLALFANLTGGTSPFSYSWNGPASFAPGNVQNPTRLNATGAFAGTYSVTVTDANLCTASGSTSVSINSNLIASGGTADTICLGASATIGGSPTATGGTSPYSYAWNNGGGTNANPVVSPATNTTYTVTVTDNIGCTATATSVVSVNPTPTADAGSDKTLPTCSTTGTPIGGVSTGSGGTAPYTYAWSPATGLSSTTVSNPNVLGITVNTTYNVTVTDANGCTATDQVIVNVAPNTLGANISFGGSNEWCAGTGGSVVLTANVTGGTAPYTYAWGGTSISPTNAQAATAGPNTAGTFNYNVTATDAFGCQVVASTSILVNPLPVADAGVDDTICNTDQVTLGGTPPATGGTAPYFYNWSGGAVAIGNPTVSPSTTTTYILTVTDLEGCTGLDTVVITVNPRPAVNAGDDVILPVCSTTGIGIGGSPTATGGTAPYNYSWTPTFGLITPGSSNPVVLGITNTTTYTVSVTDALGCSNTDAVTVNVVPNSLNINISNVGPVEWCQGSGSSVNFTANVSGGTTPYTYAWTGNSLNAANTQTVTASPTVPGLYTYTVTATDSFGCTIQSSIQVRVNALPVVNAGSAQTSCSGEAVTLGGSPTASGGTPLYSYNWSGGLPGASNPVVNPTTTTVYTLTVVDSKGCQASGSTTVNVTPKPTADAGVDQSTPACATIPVVLGGGPTGSGGTAPYTFEWSPAGGLSSDTAANPSVTSLGSSTVYTVTVTDANGCTASDQVLVTVTGSSLNVVIIPNTSLFWCENSGGSVTFTALPSGGTAPYTLAWVGANLTPDTGTLVTANPNVAGVYPYSVTLTDALGCQATSAVNVTIHPSVQVSAGPASDTICNGDTVIIGGFPTAVGGKTPYTYSWNNGASPVANPTVSPSATTTYTVVVTDSNSCSASASTTIVVRTNPVASAGSDVILPSCSPSGVQIGGGPTGSGGGGAPYTYLWSPAVGLSSTTIANPTVSGIPQDTIYTVVVTDANGCTASDQVLVDVTTGTLSASISSSGGTSWCANTNTTSNLTANTTGGTGPLSYNWSGSFITPANAQVAAVSPNIAGSYVYRVTVTDVYNCTATATTTITVDTIPTANAGSGGFTICSGESVVIGGSPTASGGEAPYSYSWNGGAAPVANPTVNPTITTSYTVIVTDNNGCTARSTTIVNVNGNPTAHAGADKTLPGCSPTGVQLGDIPAATGGTAPYTYAWSPTGGLSSSTAANPTAVGLVSDTLYTLVVTDANGCTASDQVLVDVVNNTPVVNITSSGATQWCAGSGGTTNLTANVTGGTSTFIYNWSGTNISPVNAQVATVNPNIAGSYTYTVTVTDAFNCTASATRTIVVDSLPRANAGGANGPLTVCSGGSVQLGASPTASGGTGPYTYAWNNGAAPTANPTVNPVTTTTYTVTVTDSKGCTATASVTVLVRQNPVAAAGPDVALPACSPTGVSIGGSPTASGGTPGYTYLWSPSTGLSDTSIANPTVTGLVADQLYTVVVTDVNGCTASDQVLVDATTTSPTVTITSATVSRWCLGSVASVNLSANVSGGTNPITYIWSGTNLTPGNGQVVTVSPSAAGTYTYAVTITDAYNCTASATHTITIDSLPTANAGSNTTICNGETAVLGGSPTATGGTGPYTYNWSNGAAPTANPVVSPLFTTTYIVTVTDANGCTATSSSTVTVRPRPIVDAGPDKSLPGCSPSGIQIGGSPTATGGGGGPYTYTWSPSTGLSDTTAANPTVTGIVSNTTYTVVVRDANNCSTSDQVLVSVVNNTPAITITSSNGSAWCANVPTSTNLTANVTGGTAPFSFTWSGTNVNPANTQVVTASPGGAGSYVYNVTVTDGFNCTSSATITIRIDSIPTATAGPQGGFSICNGTSVQIGGTPTATGGNAPYTYNWSNGAAPVANPTVSPITTTTYIVTVTDSRGCSVTAATTVVVRPLPVVNAGPDRTLPGCSPTGIVIGGSPTASGNPGGFTYVWSPSTGLNDTSIANPTVTGITSNTTYTVVVTNADGCTAGDQVNVNVVNTTPIANITSSGGNAWCFGTTTSVNLTANVTSGTAPFSYSWSGSDINPTNTQVVTVNPSALGPHVYTVTVTDAFNCTATTSFTVTVNPNPVANAGVDFAVCAGTQFTLGGTPAASGGSGSGYTYVWTPTVGLDNPFAPNPSGVAFATTTFQLTVYDSRGCSSTDNIIATIYPVPVARAGVDKVISVCAGDSVIIGDIPAVTGGTTPYTITWSPATGLSATNIANPVVKGITTSTTYTLTVVDTNGCSSVDFVTVFVTPSTLTINAGPDNQLCAGNCVQLGTIPAVTGGTPPFVYTWSGAGLNDSTLPNPAACPAITTTYAVTVTDSKGCVATDAVVVTVNNNPVANAGTDTAICQGTTITIGGSPSASGGTAPYTYSWSPSQGLSSTIDANPSVAAPVAITTYTLTVTDSKNCTASDMVIINYRPNPTSNAGGPYTLVSCAADSIMLGGIPSGYGGTGPYTYDWTFGDFLNDSTIANPVVKGLTSTTGFSLLVTDTFGCQAISFTTVTVVQSTLQAEAGNSNVVCAAAGTPVQLGGTPTAGGGTPPYVYHWAPGNYITVGDSTSPNPTVVVSTTTTFYLTVTDAKGCISTDSVIVTQRPSPTANAGADTTFCQGFCVALGDTSSASGGTGPYQYLWSPTIGLNANNAAHPLACPLVATVYTVVVTDANGCTASDNVTINVRTNPTADAGIDRTITTCSADSVRVGGSPSASGGQPPYTYAWSPAQFVHYDTLSNPWIVGLTSSQLFQLVVTDANGCSSVDAVLVDVVPSTLIAEAGATDTICQGAGVSLRLGGFPTASGGNPTYNYTWAPTTNLDTSDRANPLAYPNTTTTYYVTVTDSKGCIAVDSVTIYVFAPPVANAGADTAICANQTVILGGAPTGTGGTGVLNYSWSPTLGLNNSAAANPRATPSITTTYVVTVTDGLGCTATDNILVTVRSNPSAHAGPDRPLVACSNDSVRLGDTPAATGGTPPYTYLWTPGAGLSCTNCTNPWVSRLGSSTNFTLLVTDTFGCFATDQVVVNVSGSTLSAEAGNNVAFCAGASINVTLGGTPTAVGGTPPYTYTWTPATFLNQSNVANPVASPTSSITYSLQITDANGCIASDTVRITINPRPVVTAGTPDTICAGSCVELGGRPTASGGTGSTYTYSWTPALFFSTPTDIPNPLVCPTTNITYIVNVTDSIGCTNTSSVTIRVNQNPVANAGADKSVVYCANACATLGATPTATQGTPFPGGIYLYAWSPSKALNNTGLSNPTVCNLDSTTTYSVTVTDANGCTAVDNALITSSPTSLRADAGIDKSICAGQSTCVSIGAVPSVSGGTGPYVINWSPLAGLCTANGIPNPQVNPTDTTTYIIAVTDAFGCIAVDSMVLFANPAVTASVDTDVVVCSGKCATLGGNPTGSGGTPSQSPPGYTFLWSPSTGLSSISNPNPVACVSIPGTTSYCVTVTDAVGCTASTCQRLTVNPALLVNAGPDQTIAACPGSFAILGGSPTAAGGSNNYTYRWSPDSVGGVRVLNSTILPNPIVVNLTTTTTFTVRVTDNVTGCDSVDYVTIFVNPSTLTADAGLDKIFCANSSQCINIGGSPATASGGQPPYIYQWAPVLGMNNPTVANPCVLPLISGDYKVTVTDALGCFQVDSMHITVSPRIVVNAGKDTAVCYNTSVVLGANPTAVGGTGSFTYSWSPSQFLDRINSANPVATNVTSNICYTVVINDSLGCIATDVVCINTRALPSANAGPGGTLVACSGDSIILGGSPTASGTVGPYTYSWNPPIPVPVDGANPVVRNLGFTTQFCVTVTDSFGCSSVPSCAIVPVVPNTLFVEAGTPGSLCSNIGGCVTLGGTGGTPTVTGGFPPYRYQWFDPQTVSDPNIANPQACPLTSTTYTLVVTDDHNCQASDTVSVVVNQPPTVSILNLDTSYCVNAGNIVLQGNQSPSGVFSGPGVNNGVFQPSSIGPGRYIIRYTYTDPQTGCSQEAAQEVAVYSLPVVAISGNSPSYCRYEAPVTLTGTPAGGIFTGPGINGTTFDPGTANIGNNVVTYSYTDSATGCSNTTQVSITVFAAPAISINLSADTVCRGGQVTASPNYGPDVINIQWTQEGSPTIFASGLAPVTFTPTGTDYCVVARAISNNGCVAYDTVCIHVNAPPVAEIVGLNSQYCVDATPVNLTQFGIPQGGTFSGPGVTGNTFNPAGLNGNTCITYTYTDPNTGCTDDTTVCITVNPKPVLSVTGYNQSGYCSYDTAITVTGTPAGGTFSGTGISAGGVFTPSQAATGANALTYSYTDTATGCSNTLDFTITIKALPTITITANDDSICAGQPVTLSPNYSLDVYNIIWTQIGAGTPFASGTNPVTITPAGVVDFVATAQALSNNGCNNIDTFSIHINQNPVAGDDFGETCEELADTIDVTLNDTDPEGDASTVTVLSAPHGTTTVQGGQVIYTPNRDYNGNDTVTYVICNTQCANACDTAVIAISICPVNDTPVLPDTGITTCRDSALTVCLGGYDVDGDPITYSGPLAGDAVNGTFTASGSNGCYTYTPDAGYFGSHTIRMVVCDNNQTCDTAAITINVAECNQRPVAADDDVAEVCDYASIDIPVLANDSDPNGNTLKVTRVTQPAGGTLAQGTIAIGSDSTFVTYTPGNNLGTFTMSYVVCDNGTPQLCDTALVSVNVIPCTPVTITPVADTTCMNTAKTVCLGKYITSTAAWNISGISAPKNGTALSDETNDTCFIYTPADNFAGNDTFTVTVCDDAGNCDSAQVIITTLDCLTQAVDDNCDVNMTPVNTPKTVDVTLNDILPLGSDTTVTIVSAPDNATAVVNADNTITVTPGQDYQGPVNLVYEVCVRSGSYSYCDTATLCVQVIDTNCYIPNAFSPNGDGTNDLYIIPCADEFPEAELFVFDRWGVEVWRSNGQYKNDWGGTNQQGTKLPDATYYMIYEYNDGTGRRIQKFVVIHR